jgi:hypothetical protein
MADVTINQLSEGLPNKSSAIIPFSDGTTTYKTSPSGIVAASPGCILQVKQAIRTTGLQHSTTQGWDDISGVSIDITPSSSNSKFLISWSGAVSVNYAYGGSTQVQAFKVVRTIGVTSTNLALGNIPAGSDGFAAGSVTYAVSYNVASTMGGTYLDTPPSPTSSLVNYKLMWWAEAPGSYAAWLGGSIRQNQAYSTNVPTFLTVQEIAG